MAKIVAEKLNLPLGAVILAYKSFWDNIKENIENSDIINVTEETEITYPLSYSVQFLGKLYTEKTKILKINKHIKDREAINENT